MKLRSLRAWMLVFPVLFGLGLVGLPHLAIRYGIWRFNLDSLTEQEEEALISSVVAWGQPAIPPLIESLSYRRFRAARAHESLRRLGSQAVPFLRQAAMSHQDPFVRVEAAEILCEQGLKEGIGTLVQLLDCENSRVRYFAAYAMERILDDSLFDIEDAGRLSDKIPGEAARWRKWWSLHQDKVIWDQESRQFCIRGSQSGVPSLLPR